MSGFGVNKKLAQAKAFHCCEGENPDFCKINRGPSPIVSQKGFSWSSVAISAVGATAGAYASDKLGLNGRNPNPGKDLGRAAVNAGANALAQITIRGGKVNWQQVATDTILNFTSTRLQGYVEAKNAELIAQQRAAQGNTTTYSGGFTGERINVAGGRGRTDVSIGEAQDEQGLGGQAFADYWAQKDERLLQQAAAYKPTFLDYGVGLLEVGAGSSYNLGVASGAGLRGLVYAGFNGADAGVAAIQESQNTAGYQYRSEGAKAILAGISNSETVQTVGRGFNSLKTNTGDFYYNQFGPLAGAVGSVLPDTVAILAGPKVLDFTVKTTARGLIYAGGKLDAMVSSKLAATLSFGKINFIGDNFNAFPIENRIPNLIAGEKRANLVLTDLQTKYPSATIQKEVYLRSADGRKAIDPLSNNEGRRIDFVVIENGKVIDSVEVTSMRANKLSQQAKEDNIRQNGGTFIKDRATGKLLDISNIKTTLERRN